MVLVVIKGLVLFGVLGRWYELEEEGGFKVFLVVSILISGVNISVNVSKLIQI